MIEFMVLGAPRSGTAWAANWLTTEHSLCLHDPLWTRHYEDLDSIRSTKRMGVACTGLALFTDWTNRHPARKLILHRDLDEVNASLEKIGMPPVPPDFEARLGAIAGYHYRWERLFEPGCAQVIYEYLLEQPFDVERHRALRDLEVQTRFEGIHVDKAVTARLVAELQRAAHTGMIQ